MVHNDPVQGKPVISKYEAECQVPILRNFVTKDSGQREEFATGSRRDTQEGKLRWDLLPLDPVARVVGLYTRGAIKYGEGNWQKGQPLSRTYASLFRHLTQWRMGDRDEDHLAAVAWNAFALMYYEDAILAGKLPRSLDDLGLFPNPEVKP